MRNSTPVLSTGRVRGPVVHLINALYIYIISYSLQGELFQIHPVRGARGYPFTQMLTYIIKILVVGIDSVHGIGFMTGWREKKRGGTLREKVEFLLEYGMNIRRFGWILISMEVIGKFIY